MGKFSISQVSEQLKISKDTLRYYDKPGLLRPERGDNKYRYYTERDMLDLQYIQVLSFTGFSLSEISHLFRYMKTCDVSNFPAILQIFKRKRADLAKQIMIFQAMIDYVDEAEEIISNKSGIDIMDKIDTMVAKMFEELKELRSEMQKKDLN